MGINVVDSIMGSGKSSWARNMINSSPNEKFIYITPYLDEVDNVINNCPNFEQPQEHTEDGETCLKQDSFHELLAQGKNIVSTHQLFKLSTSETVELLKKQNYTIICDEVLDVVNYSEINRHDLKIAIDADICRIDDDNYLVWNDELTFDDNKKYRGQNYRRLKILCKSRSIFLVNGQALVWIFPPKIFKYFKNIYILTYLFDAQIMKFYFDLYGFAYEKYRVIEPMLKQYELIKRDKYVEDTSNLKNLIDICSKGKINDIGTVSTKEDNAYTRLSKTWFEHRATNNDLDQLRKNLENFFKSYCGTTVEYNLWTTFVDYRDNLKGRRYPDFLAHNSRAINEYRHKTCVAYVLNKYMHRSVVDFFKSKGIKIDKATESQYALSEMLQFLFRSAIRDNRNIKLYIPSCRMRGLLKEWLGIPKK